MQIGDLAQISMKLDIFLGILAHTSLSLGEYLLDLKSVHPRKVEDKLETGCIFTGTEVVYQCIKAESSGDDHHNDVELPQALNFRIDCRGARGNFQNLTLYDSSRSCGRLSYRKYGNSSDIKPLIIGKLPLYSDHTVTIQKGDILDIQCVPFDLEFDVGLLHQPDLATGKIKDELWEILFSLLLDGQDMVQNYQAFDFIMIYWEEEAFRSCTKTLVKTYQWQMKLSNSIGFTYWIRYSSPAVEQKASIFPNIDLCFNISGEIFHLDKDILQLSVLEASSYSILGGSEEFKKNSKTDQWFVRLDTDFYNSTIAFHRFRMEFKLEVNPKNPKLLPDTTDVKVKLQLFSIKIGKRRHPFFSKESGDAHLSFELLLPVNNTGREYSESESRVIWMIAFFFFICLLCGFCYVYREDFQMLSEPLQNRNLMVEANSVSIELQGS